MSNAAYVCVDPGQDAFLGRGIRTIVIDPNNSDHIFVGSAQAIRGLSHTIGAGGGTRLEPGANEAGLYESTDGGETFTEIWDGNARGGAQPPPAPWGINDVELDPLNSNTVYASAFDAGLWRRDAGAALTRSPGLRAAVRSAAVRQSSADPADVCLRRYGPDHVRAHGQERPHARLPHRRDREQRRQPEPLAANFWRTDNANQPAATLLASQAAGITAPAAGTHTFPATYNGWQKLTSNSTASPYYPTIDFCTGQCWYDQNVYTPAGLPDTVYVVGSYTYGEIPCNTKGVGCGSGRSNGRAVIYSTTAGDPDATATGGAVNRTFTDLTFDAQNDPSATWCALGAAQAPVAEPFRCLWAPNSIHPDEHVIAVNPSNPTQIFQGSDGAMIRTSGTFSDISFRCNDSNERPTLGAASLVNCARLLSRVPTKIDHIDTNYSSTLQFINVAINPLSTCEVMGGTQDNGTWSNIDNCDTNTFWQVIYGDGGNAGYDKTTAWRFNEFTSGASDSNFKNGNPEKWVITSAPVVRSGEGAAFYWPLIADPNPVSFGGQVTHPTYSGAKHVWRSWAFGAGHPGAVPQDTSPDIAFYENNCQEFTVSSTNPACGDNRPLGGPYCEGAAACVNAPGDLTGTVYGADRSGGSISFLARTSSDHGTLWAATGRPAVRDAQRGRRGSGGGDLAPDRQRQLADPVPERIYVDPADSGHAWVSYSGYNAITPTTPGHVFDVHENGVAPNSGVFVNLNVEQGTGEFPTPFGDGDCR